MSYQPIEPTVAYDVKNSGMAHVYMTGKNGGSLHGYTQELNVPVLPKIIVEKIHPDAVIPTYASEGDSGMDVYAVEDLYLAPGETALCALGLKIGIPRHPLHELGYRWEAQARPRSGVSLKTTLRVPNAPGTIDNFYTDEVKIILHNAAGKEHELDTERDDDTRAVERVTLEPSRHTYVTGLKGGSIFTGNFNSYESGTILINKGDRIAQIVFNQVIRPMEIVEGTVDASVSRGGGFGHSGV